MTQANTLKDYDMRAETVFPPGWSEQLIAASKIRGKNDRIEAIEDIMKEMAKLGIIKI